MSDALNLSGGFKDPAIDAARAFRVALNAMSQPGQIFEMTGIEPPAPLSEAAGALLLTLIDHETPVHLGGRYNSPAVKQWLSFHTGAPFLPAPQALFAIGRWQDLLPLAQFAHGEAEYPERSATLIVECDQLLNTGSCLTGPGIKSQTFLNLPDERGLAANAALFPLGLDFYLTAGSQISGLPRSTRIGGV